MSDANEISQTRALIIGEDLFFVKDAVIEKLEKQGAKVDREIKKETYDYILVFGEYKNKNRLLKKLKGGGKYLQVLTLEKEIKTKWPFFEVDTFETNTADQLAYKILQKLFSQSPYLHKEIIKEKKSKKTKNIISVLTALFLLLSPLFFFLTVFFLGVKDLKSLRETDLSYELKKKKADSAVTEITLARKSGYLLSGLIAPFFPKTEKIVKNSLSILENIAVTAKQGINLEEAIKSPLKAFIDGSNGLDKQTLEEVKSYISEINANLTEAKSELSDIERFKNDFPLNRYYQKLEKIPEYQKITEDGEKLISVLPSLLSIDGKKKYLILLQNNLELRPTGGFIGSYATVELENGRLKDVKVQDVYSADGQLKGHVEPPLAFNRYLNQPNWFFRDSNWEPDFAASAVWAEWFMEKEKGEKFDGVIGCDLDFAANLLAALDGVYVPDYQAKVTASDFFIKLESETSSNNFAGSTQKKDVLGSLMSATMIDLKERKDLSFEKLATNIYNSLSEKHLLISLSDKEAQKTVDSLGWGGRILSEIGKNTDYFMLVEANLGVNKVNYHMKRQVDFRLNLSKTELERVVKIIYTNESDAKSSFQTDGIYKDYLRILLPAEANVGVVKVDGRSLDRGEIDQQNISQKLSVGFLVSTAPQSSSEVEITYRTPLENNYSDIKYRLMIQKQSGVDSIPFSFSTSSGLTNSFDLKKDKMVAIDFKGAVE